MYKKVIPILLLGFITYIQVVAQNINNYQLIENRKVGNLTDMSSGTQQLIGNNSSEIASEVTDLGFNFVFMGKVYNQFSVNTNGVLRLGDEQVVTGANTYGIPGNDRIVPMAGVSYEYRFLFWWTQGNADFATLNNGKVHSKIFGSAPNRTLVVEWKNVGFGNSATTFQVRLYESAFGSGKSGKIEFVYDNFNLNNSNRNFAFRTGFGIGPEDGNFVAVDQKNRSLTSTQNYISTISDEDDANNFTGSGANKKLLLSFETIKKPAGQFSDFAEICKGTNAITISFKENCPDEAGIAVYRKKYGQNDSQFALVKSLAADAQSMSDGTVASGERYVYRFHLLSEGKYADTYRDYTTSVIEAGAAYQTVSSGAWTDNKVWGSSMPGSNDDVVIGCGGSVFININSNTQVHDLTIEKGSFLTVEDGVTLSIKGSFTNNGVFTPVGNARVSFNGNTRQTVVNNGQGMTNDTQYQADNTKPAWSKKTGIVAEKTLTVSDAKLSAIKSITVDLTHTKLRDIILNLVAPNGQVFVLSNGRGQSGDNYTNVTFAETGQLLPPRAQNVNLTGSYRPEESFASYTGALAGTWKLQVSDGFGTEDGRLNSFSMIFSKGTSNDLVLNRLTIDNNSREGITLNSGLHIQAALQLTNGIVHTTAEKSIFLEAGAEANEGSDKSFIDGPMYKQGNTNFSFPVGDNGKWSPVRLSNFKNANNNTVFMVEYFKASYGKGDKRKGVTSVSQNEYWEIEPVSGNPTVDISLHWKDPLFSKLTDALLTNDLVVAHYTNGEWVNEGGIVSLLSQLTNLGYLTAKNISSFSPFTFGSEGNTTLPVELLSFSAVQGQAGVDLNWETASEQDNSHFEVQRSHDGHQWVNVGRVEGSGTTQENKQYAYVDAAPFQQNCYYRLKQVDYDGAYEYSRIAYVAFTNEELTFSFYPNPATDQITVKSSSYPATIEIINQNGITVAQQQVTAFQTTLPLQIHQTGVYMLKLQSPQGIKYEKMVIRKQ